jgi:MFS family permease
VPEAATVPGWRALLTPAWMLALAVMLGGVLLHSMNVMLLATVLPSIVAEVGGTAMMSWPTTSYLASSILAGACTGLVTAKIGAGRAFSAGAALFCAGTLLCAFAPSMTHVVVGRFVQGFGGGLLSALSYVLVRQVFPSPLWPRIFALLSGVWGISVLIGPLVGGVFADYGHWRDAFFAVAALAIVLAVFSFWALPRGAASDTAPSRVPLGRVAIVSLGIVAVSAAAVVQAPLGKAGMIGAAVAMMMLALWLDRRAGNRLLPRDAFSLRSATGAGLWVVLLLSISFTPMSIYGPLFLQHLHGFSPLAAGYMVATSSMSWTIAAMLVASLTGPWPGRLLVAGPLSAAAGLFGVSLLMPAGPIAALPLPIAAIGGGAGLCWAFLIQRIMHGAAPGDEDSAAAAGATVQQVGIAFGAAAAGLIANTIGLQDGLEHTAILSGARWVPVWFVAAALGAGLLALRLNALPSR